MKAGPRLSMLRLFLEERGLGCTNPFPGKELVSDRSVLGSFTPEVRSCYWLGGREPNTSSQMALA